MEYTPIPNFHMSVDATDCPIQKPLSSQLFSHKPNGAVFRCEVGVSIRPAYISWMSIPYPCGTFLRIRIFREGLKWRLGAHEKVISDN